ncbi:MAG: glycosyltransferase [Sphingobium sp.]|nr:glycosyltransferase [Sphingobium sp.]
MKILTFLHSFEPGGVERIALRLVRQWREKGMDAPLFLGRRDGAMAQDVGAELDYITPDQPMISTARWETLWMIATLPRIIRQQRPDVLFCAGNSYSIVAVAMKLILGRQCPLIIAKISNDLDRRDQPLWQRAPYHFWLKFQARYLDHIIGMEEPMTDEIHTIMGVPLSKISIIPDPALSDALIEQLRTPAPSSDCSPSPDNSLIRSLKDDVADAHTPTALPSASPIHTRIDGRHFVSVGRLSAQKNIALMLRAFSLGANGNDHLTIIGDGPDRRALKALAQRLNLAERVTFRGYISDPARLLPQYDIFLLSSDYEGVPAVIVEALAAGLPIIATNCSRSMPALLRQGALGQLVPIGDAARLAAAIAQARPSSQDMQASLDQAKRFTIEQAAQYYLGIIESMLRAHPQARQASAITLPTAAIPATAIPATLPSKQPRPNAQWGNDAS